MEHSLLATIELPPKHEVFRKDSFLIHRVMPVWLDVIVKADVRPYINSRRCYLIQNKQGLNGRKSLSSHEAIITETNL